MFYGEFKCEADVYNQFEVKDEERVGITMLYASYECESYEGAAGVLFVRNGQFHLVTGSHCSCYGLEDQWQPEPITLAEIRHYIVNKATPYGIDFETFKKVVDAFEHLDTEVLSDEHIAMILKLMMG